MIPRQHDHASTNERLAKRGGVGSSMRNSCGWVRSDSSLPYPEVDHASGSASNHPKTGGMATYDRSMGKA